MAAQSVLNTVIRNQDIHHIVSLRNSRSALKRRLEIVQNELDKVETEVILFLQAGLNINSSYSLSLKEEVRHSVSWKSVVANLLGHEKCGQIMLDTVPTITIKLLIKDK